MNTTEKILNNIENQNGYITTTEVVNLGINKFYITQLVNDGKLERVSRGVYKKPDYYCDNEIIEASKMVKNGVICLESAIEMYNLSTNIPTSYSIAIKNKSKIKLPSYPPIQLLYFSDTNYNLGIIDYTIEGHTIKMYDIEKTVCDITRYRNKIGMDIFIECIKEYMRRGTRDIQKLYEYAKKTRTYNTLKPYIEVLR